MAEKRTTGFSAVLAGAAENPWLRQLLIMVAIAASVAIGVAAVLWSREPDYRTLYSSMDTQRAAAVVEALTNMGMRYRLEESTGSVMVPADQLHEARLKLAGAGLTRETGGMSFLQEEKGFGVSEFMQSKKYQHALETELARTIESMRQVRRARVHLAIPKQTVFVRDRKPPSASIMLEVLPGSVVDKQNVSAIINMVASSIPDLQPEHVTVVDQQGNLLSSLDRGDELELSSRQFEYRQMVERAYQRRIEELLRPITASGRVQVQVAADIDFASMQESRESWNPDQQVIRSEQINSETQSQGAKAIGIPGALTNQPPGARGNGANGEGNQLESQSIVRNYEIERILNHTSNPGGNISRLSVAVVVDNGRSVDENGQTVTVPTSPEELDKLTQLVRDAVGFNEARGDRVTVISADFRMAEPAEFEEPGFWESAWFSNLVKQGLVGIGLILLVLMILRPAMRILTRAHALPGPSGTRAQLALAGGGGSGMPEAQPAVEETIGGAAAGQPAALGLPGRAASRQLEERMDAVRTAAGEDPRLVAQVVRKWVTEDAER